MTAQVHGARIALVTAIFDREARTNVDRFAFAFATHMALAGVQLEVLTTCAHQGDGDVVPNYYRAGRDGSEAFPIWRFRSEDGDRPRFQAALARLADGEHADDDALFTEGLRAPNLIAHLRSAAERYDAFVFVDATAHTTVLGAPIVLERAVLVPLLTESVLFAAQPVQAVLRAAPLLLWTSEAEAALAQAEFGLHVGATSRVMGMGVDVTPESDLPPSPLVAGRHGRPYVVSLKRHDDALDVIALDAVKRAERQTVIARATALDLGGAKNGFCPELFEAWAYAKPVIVDADAGAPAALVRETGAGWLVGDAAERAAARAQAVASHPAALDGLVRGGRAYVQHRLSWRRAVINAIDAIDGLAALDDGRSREATLAQLAYLLPLARRQRRTIEVMRVSRFWRLRDAWFALKRRLKIGPLDDPIPDIVEDPNALRGAFGDEYFLFRDQQRLRPADIERIRTMAAVLSERPTIGLVIELGRAGLDGLQATLASMSAQIYDAWTAVIVAPPENHPDILAVVGSLENTHRIRVSATPSSDEVLVGAVRAGDLLEPHALFELVLKLNAQPDLDAIYTDEDTLVERRRYTDPYFKPDWSPETYRARDYVGGLCILRRSTLEAVGGLNPSFGSATWYEALLRVSEVSERIGHLAQILYHGDARNRTQPADLQRALEAAIRRNGEAATVVESAHGPRIVYAIPASERVTIIIPTRDRVDLLEPCLTSVFERSTFPNFDLIVVDNGSQEQATAALFAQWSQREPKRFRVIRDDEPFNYSRLNNRAVAETNADYVLFLNNDTVVIAPDWIEASLGYARQPKVGAVGALLLYPDDTVQHAGVVMGILGLAGHAYRLSPLGASGYHGSLHGVTNYAAVTGACLLVSREKFLEIGGFDETLAVSYNDVDLCMRLLAHGYRNVYVPQTRLYHFESKSRGTDDSPAKVARAMREVALFRERWPSISKRDPYYNPNLTIEAEDFSLRL